MELIAKTFQGLEPLLAQELTANDIQIGRRMVSFTGDKAMLYRANFCLRTAIRILKPIKHFKARSADDVYNAVQSIDWSDYLTPQTTFAVDSVVFSQEFKHSKFVAYKVKDAIVDQFRERSGERPNVSVSNPDIQLHIHISDFDATLALDSSGESLHRRGYRQEKVAAPLNEVLAAGIVMMSGWDGKCDFIDPFCGSGTIAIEAALIARGIAPGVFRKDYAFEKWPDFDADLFSSVFNDDSSEREFNHHIYGYDNDPNAVGIALRNIKSAGLSKDITVEMRDFKDFTKPAEKAIIITNPPYGERISSPDLIGLYHLIGQKLKHELSGGEAWILSYHEECFEAIGLKPSLRTPLYNGSLECEVRKYQLFEGRYNDLRAQGGDIKNSRERRLMADNRRFKQNRDTRERHDDDDTRDFGQRGRHFEHGNRHDFGDRRREHDDKRRGERREDRYRDRRDDRFSDRRDDRRDDRRGSKGGAPFNKHQFKDRNQRQEARKRYFKHNEED